MNIYNHALDTMNRDWLHDCVHELVVIRGGDLTNEDYRAFCRFLRGFHMVVFGNSGDYWASYTQPNQSYGPFFNNHVRHYLVSNWVFLVDYIPTLPSNPSALFRKIERAETAVVPQQTPLL